jgi:hypothetical protein
MVAIPERNVIFDKLEDGEIDNSPRPYLGYSMIGEQCLRYLQYYHRMAFTAKISRRISRLFEFGKYMEKVFEDDLSRIGIKMRDAQIEVVGFMGHWKGHLDGILSGVPTAEKTDHLAEFKTHNDEQFKKLQKEKDVKKTHPKHFYQATAYMGRMKLKRALYLGYNKNDSSYYAERLYFDKEEFDELVFKEEAVVKNAKLFPRIGNGKETWHECRFCPAKQVCYNKEPIVRNCRTCEHVEVHLKGQWKCGNKKSHMHGKVLMLKNQESACDMYELDEELQ